MKPCIKWPAHVDLLPKLEKDQLSTLYLLGAKLSDDPQLPEPRNSAGLKAGSLSSAGAAVFNLANLAACWRATLAFAFQ